MLVQKPSLTEGNLASPSGDGHDRQVSDNRTLTAIHNELKDPLAHIDRADPTKIQCVAAANLEMNDKYHNIILQQANMSFRFAMVIAFLGFFLFSGTVIFFMLHQTGLALISTTGSAITAILSGTAFYLYCHTLSYFKDIHQCLARTELLLLGNSLCMQICDKEKQTAAYMDLIRNVTQLTVLISEDEHRRISKIDIGGKLEN